MYFFYFLSAKLNTTCFITFQFVQYLFQFMNIIALKQFFFFQIHAILLISQFNDQDLDFNPHSHPVMQLDL